MGTRASHGLANISSAWCKVLSILGYLLWICCSPTCYGNLTSFLALFLHLLALLHLVLYLLWIKFDYNSLYLVAHGYSGKWQFVPCTLNLKRNLISNAKQRPGEWLKEMQSTCAVASVDVPSGEGSMTGGGGMDSKTEE